MAEDQKKAPTVGGVAGWLWTRLRGNAKPRPSLALLERITLAPRQSLALIEAEGRKFLVATSADGSPAFYPLEDRRSRRAGATGSARVSW